MLECKMLNFGNELSYLGLALHPACYHLEKTVCSPLPALRATKPLIPVSVNIPEVLQYRGRYRRFTVVLGTNIINPLVPPAELRSPVSRRF